jgi:hypothetical protein
MALTSAPRGFEPIGVTGAPYSHGVYHFTIAAGYATRIDNGDPVIGVATGFIERFNATRTATTSTVTAPANGWLGVLVGVQYTDPNTRQPTWNHYYPGGITPPNSENIDAFVTADPDQRYLLQANGAAAQTFLFNNAGIIQTAEPTGTIGNSGLQLDTATEAATATLPVKVVDFSRGAGDAIGDAFTNLIVVFNIPTWRTATGI